jgi:hypothetical protein
MLDSTSRAGTGAKKPEMNRPVGTQPHIKTLARCCECSRTGIEQEVGPCYCAMGTKPWYVFCLSMEASISNCWHLLAEARCSTQMSEPHAPRLRLC